MLYDADKKKIYADGMIETFMYDIIRMHIW